MKKAEECSSIEDIRTCIDEIDRDIISYLSMRSTFVNCAAKFKTSMADVMANKRVESMIKVRRDWASKNGVRPDFIESIFRIVVSHFIGNEIKEWSKDKTNGDKIAIVLSTIVDAKAILSLQKRAYVQEVELNDNNFNIPPMLQDIESMRNDFANNTILKATLGDLIIGSVRAKQIDSTCFIGRLIIEPIYQKQGIGRNLLQSIEKIFPDVLYYELFTGVKSIRNREFYKNAGYVEEVECNTPDGTRLIRLRKKKIRRTPLWVCEKPQK